MEGWRGEGTGWEKAENKADIPGHWTDEAATIPDRVLVEEQ